MTDNTKTSVPSTEGQTQTEQPSGGTEPGSGKKQDSEVPSQIPDNLKGKSEQELIQMYQGLEKKIGEQSEEVNQARKKVKNAEESEKNIQVLMSTLQSDEKLYKQVQQGINKYLYGDTEDTSSAEGNGDAGKTTRKQGKVPDDTRRTVQKQIVSNFYNKYGIDKLDADGFKQEQGKIGNALANILDPSGKKSIRQIFNEVPLDQLDGYLESAYIVANKDKIKKSAETAGILNAQQNKSASIGSLSSSTGEGGSTTLTAEERIVAKNLGVSDKDYLESKQKGKSK
jgi:phage I-like protein